MWGGWKGVAIKYDAVKVFSLARRLTVSLNATGALVVCGNGIIISRPSVMTLSIRANGIITVNRRTHRVRRGAGPGVGAVQPLGSNIVTSFGTARLVLHNVVGGIGASNNLFTPSLHVIVYVPSNSAGIRVHTIHSSTRRTNNHRICVVCRPVTTTLNTNLSIRTPRNGVIVSVNNNASRVTYVSLNNVIYSRSVGATNSIFAGSVRDCIHRRRGVHVNRHATRTVGYSVNTTISSLSRRPRSFIIANPGVLATLPRAISLDCDRVTCTLRGSLAGVSTTLVGILRSVPPRLCTSVIGGNVCLTNNNTLVGKLSQHLGRGANVPFRVTRSPLHTVTHNANVTLGGVGHFSFLVG